MFITDKEFRGRVDAEGVPEQTDYGMLEFTIKDPNRYHLSLVQVVEGQA